MLWREKCPYYGDGGVLIMGIEVTLNTVAQAGSKKTHYCTQERERVYHTPLRYIYSESVDKCIHVYQCGVLRMIRLVSLPTIYWP